MHLVTELLKQRLVVLDIVEPLLQQRLQLVDFSVQRIGFGLLIQQGLLSLANLALRFL